MKEQIRKTIILILCLVALIVYEKFYLPLYRYHYDQGNVLMVICMIVPIFILGGVWSWYRTKKEEEKKDYWDIWD